MGVMGLNPRQKRFVLEYLRCGIGKDAAVAAGYSPRSAEQQASRLLSMPEVQAYRRELESRLFQERGISKEWLGSVLLEILDRCMQRTPVLEWNSETRQKEPNGTWAFDPNGALKAVHELYVQLGFAQGGEETGEQRKSFEDWLREQESGSRL